VSERENVERLIPESQLKQAVREILAEMLGVQSQQPGRRKAYPTSQAYKLLGYDSPSQLYDAVESGLLRVGKEVQDRRKPQAVNARYYFDIEACQKRLAESPERRKA
jgi:hypothetical protein